MKVIFLDIDGVLNSSNWWQQRDHEQIECKPGWDSLISTAAMQDARDIDPGAVAWLNRIVHDTGAVIVISSAWRVSVPIDRIALVLKFRGFIGNIIGATPTLGTNRGFEIAWWLDLVPVEKYVIIDDDDDMEPGQPFVLTNPLFGLTKLDALLAIELLNGGKEP